MNRQDVVAATSTAMVGSLRAEQQYTASVFAYDSSGSYSSGASVTWTEPAAAPAITAYGTDLGGGLIGVDVVWPWPSSSHWGDPVMVCTTQDAPPPATAGPPALCYLTNLYWASAKNRTHVPAAVGHSYGVSVFSYSPVLQMLGPPSSVADVAVLDVPPPRPDVGVARVSAHSVTFLVANDPNYLSPLLTDLHQLVVTRATGTRPPAATADPVAVVPLGPQQTSVTYTAERLAANQAYTFAFRLRDLGGHLSEPWTLTAAAHVAGVFIADNDTRSGRWRLRLTPSGNASGEVRFGVTATGRQHLVFTDGIANRAYYSAKSPTGRWAVPRSLGSTGYPDPPTIDVSPDGRLVVGWTGPAGPVFRTKKPGAPWSALQRIPATAGVDARLLSLALDAKGRIHGLVNELAWDPSGVYRYQQPTYVTNASGRWTASALETLHTPDSVLCAKLAADPVNGSIAVLLADSAGVHIGRTGRLSAGFGQLHTLPVTGYVASCTLATRGGRLAVALADAGPTRTGAKVWTGTNPASMSQHLLPGATRSDSSPQVWMTSARRILVAWVRDDALWRPSRQGVFMSALTYHSTAPAWRFSKPQHPSDTHYDDGLTGLAADRHGHVYVGFSRSVDG